MIDGPGRPLDDQLYPKTEVGELKKNIQRLNEEREQGDIQAVLKFPEGRRLLWRLFGLSGMFRASMTGESMTTAFNEGRRDVGLVFLNDVNKADHTAFAQMQSEYYSKLKSEEVQIAKLKKNPEGEK